MYSGVSGQPGIDRLCFMGAAVIQDNVKLHVFGREFFNLPQEIKELLTPVAFGNAPRHFTSQDIKGGIQVGYSVAFIVMGASFYLSRLKLQHWLGPLKSLDLGLFVDG